MVLQESITSTTGNGEEAIACTLDSAGFVTQSERWTQILGRAAIESVETDNGISMLFRAEPGVEHELRELVAVESECCSWASWTVDVSGDRLVLRVTSCGDGVSAIHAIFSGQPAGENREPFVSTS